MFATSHVLIKRFVVEDDEPPKKKLKTADAPIEPVPVANNGVEEDGEEDEFDEDGLGEEDELEGEEEEDAFEDELEGEAEGDEEENGVDEPKKLGIDVDVLPRSNAPTKPKCSRRGWRITRFASTSSPPHRWTSSALLSRESLPRRTSPARNSSV